MSVEQEVCDAYADIAVANELVEGSYNEAVKRRTLQFRASAPVSRDEAIRILDKCVKSYNRFTPKLLEELPQSVEIVIARECSVCLFVKGKVRVSRTDEITFDPETNETRLWWD